ncbi:hypothetical protein U1Q18_035226 [Sarracenia purpurea var. burkii]
MMSTLRVQLSKHVACRYLSSDCSTLPHLMRLCSFSSIHIDCCVGRRHPLKGAQFTTSASYNAFSRSTTEPSVLGDSANRDVDYNSDRYTQDIRKPYNTGRQSPPEPIPNRPLRGEKPIYQTEQVYRGNHGLRSDGGGSGGGRGYDRSTATVDTDYPKSKTVGRGENKTGRQPPISSSDLFPFDNFGNDVEEQSMKKQYSQYSRSKASPFTSEKQGNDFLEKFKLGFDKGGKHLPEAADTSFDKQEKEMKGVVETPPPEADEIFKKMKETGLIPNAVAMLDGLCKDGLVQEAMKLFGLMREKGTIPEVVIYTAVVEGFCQAQKLDDATRIFRKMQKNGISPNSFSYTILIQGLCKGNRLEDAFDLCVEMLEAGHSPNLATFTGLVDGFCREKGLEEAQSTIKALRQKGFSFDEKLVKEYLDKKGPFLQLVWEAIFGKKSSQRSF